MSRRLMSAAQRGASGAGSNAGNGAALGCGQTSYRDFRSGRLRCSESLCGPVMALQVNSPGRIFQFWAYAVSMGQLLLRSTKTDQFDDRIDVLFQNMHAVKLPALPHGLVVADADPDMSEHIIRETGLLPDDDQRFFTLIGSSYAGYVVAGVVTSRRDLGEYYEPSQLWSGGLGSSS